MLCAFCFGKGKIMEFANEVSIICDVILLTFMVIILGFLMDVKMQTQENNEEIHELIVRGKNCPYVREEK